MATMNKTRVVIKKGRKGDSPVGTVDGYPPAKAVVRSLVQEDSTCHTEQLSPHATTPEARAPTARASQQEKPMQWEAHPLQQKVAPALCS